MAKETKPSSMNTGLENALKNIRKNFGMDSILTFDPNTTVALARQSSGILPLDMILGGGYPLGRIIEIFGPESSGKTTIAIKAISSFQKAGKVCAFIDAEHAFDPEYARNLGINLENLLFAQPDTGETALDIAEQLIRSGDVGLIVVDSVAALVPRAEIDGDMGSSHVGLHARLMSQAMRKMTGVISKSNCVVIFINQLREKVGQIYGNPEVTTGGRALKFYATIRLDVRKRDVIKEEGESVANRTRMKTVKNKTYPPFKECEIDIIYGSGPDAAGAVLDIAIKEDLIQKAGAWYKYNGEQYHGRDELKAFFLSEEGDEAFCELKEKVREILSRA